MKLTNKHNLPETIINVLKRPQYSKGAAHISVTEMLSSPRIVQLRRRHWDDIEEDASDMVWSLFGSALHNVLQHGKGDTHVVEERLFMETDGWTVSGQIDLQEIEDDGVVISDYKCTSVWSVMNDKMDWQRQLNLYALLVERTKGLVVKGVQIVAVLRDWSAREAETRADYPRAPIIVLPIPLWSLPVRHDYLRKRISAHSEALFAADTNDRLAECSSDDMWEKPTTFAIKKKGNKRATLVLKNEEEAMSQVSQLGEAYVVEKRPGERTRCDKYCSVSAWCDQYQNYKQKADDECI